MKAFFFNTVSTFAFPLTVLAVFLCFTCAWLLFLRWFRTRMEDYKEDFTSSAESTLSDMFLFVDPNQLYVINLVLLVVLPILVWLLLRDIPSTIVVFLAILLVPTLVYKSMRAKRLKRIEQQLPDALAMVAGAMRAGASLNIALENLVNEQPPPLSQEFAILIKEQRLGVDFEVSMQHMEKRIPLQDFSMLATALRINREVGGNLAETIESLGETLRRKSTMEGKIVALTSQGKMQGYVMTALPILLGVVLNFIEPDAMSKLWTTGYGWAVIGVVVVMESLGFVMIKKITSIDV
ncbi:MAG: secretion system protein F [Gammaproteobacteria bacterium]|nr:type II secretion system F family protein [Gammaproteobacteria bacterium]NNL99165.1 secretion system protein F [Gammaproteobacteria bacterium]